MLMAKSVVLKQTPKLKFLYDESVHRGNRVLSIIEELEKTSPVEPAETEEETER